MKFLLYCAILLSTMLQSECAPKSAKLSDLITCGPNVEGLAPCEDARDQLEVAAPVTPKKHESESVPKRESGRVKRQVPPSETETELPGTEESTDAEVETNTEEEGSGSEEETTVDVSGYAQFTGGWRVRQILKSCKEPAKLVDGIVSKCNIPIMCQTDEGCLTFFDVEHMFGNFHRAYKFGPHGAWSEDAYSQNLGALETNEEYDTYINIEDMKHGEPKLFQTLVNLVEDESDDQKVTIALGRTEINVNPANVCYIVTNLAPFHPTYIAQRYRKCPGED